MYDLLADGVVEVAGRLVGQDRGRAQDGGAGDRHALALATGELVRPVAGAVARPKASARRRPGTAFGRPTPASISGSSMFSAAVRRGTR